MYINESLAKGLKERLWNEVGELDIKIARSISLYVKKHKLKLGSRTCIKKLDQAISLYGQFILASAMSGTRANPLMLYAMLTRSQEAISDWNEKMFCIETLSLDVWGNYREYGKGARIGEHAVCRVFQRHPEIYNADTNEFEIFKIIPEFKDIAQYGQAMCLLFLFLPCMVKSIKNLTIPFATKSGLFLGVYNEQLGCCDVRTFIADHQLTTKQAALTQQLREHLAETYSAMFPFVVREYFSGRHEEYIRFLSNLNAVIPQFVELVTWNEHDFEVRRECQQSIVDLINSLKR